MKEKRAEFIEKWKWSAQGLDFSKELESDLDALLKETAVNFTHDIPLTGIFNEKISKEHIQQMYDYWITPK